MENASSAPSRPRHRHAEPQVAVARQAVGVVNQLIALGRIDLQAAIDHLGRGLPVDRAVAVPVKRALPMQYVSLRWQLSHRLKIRDIFKFSKARLIW